MASKRLRLIQRRRAVGFTQEQLAWRLGVERSTVLRWEAAKTEPQPWQRPKLAELLGVTTDELDDLLFDVTEFDVAELRPADLRPSRRNASIPSVYAWRAAPPRPQPYPEPRWRHADGGFFGPSLEAEGSSRADAQGRSPQPRRTALAPEQTLLGVGQVTIATPLKRELVGARPVVAVEDFTAAHRLADLARTLRLAVEFEHVPLGGAINLNRPNLVVVCGPRLSPDVASVLARDPAVRFEQAADGAWTLRDLHTGERYRSGLDQAPTRPWDAAYLGRLVRPDGRGLVMILTGIHPPGTLGVVRLLGTRLAEVYEQAGEGAFSTLVGVDYDPVIREPTRVELLSPLYRHAAQR